ncbi:MAG: DNA polymerase III subunit alpha [Salinisphaeraceae bacterium]|nr:DNA polymerase III subunit alpha [Salinisphaeraceae bacterium]
MSRPFVHLRIHSEYSLSDGMVRIPALMKALQAAGMPAVAISDNSNLFAMVKFYRAALGAGIKPIIGADIWVTGDDEQAHRLTLFCQNETGYRNLSQVLTESYLQGQKGGRATTSASLLARHSDGLIALSGAQQGEVGRALLAGHRDAARDRAQAWAGMFPGRYYLELCRTGRPDEEACTNASAELAAELELPVVATNDVRFVAPEDFEAHEVRVCIHDGYTLDDARRPRRYSQAQYLKTAEAMAALFEDIPEALDNTVEIARRCNLQLSLGKNFLPDFPVPEGHDADSFLRADSARRLEMRLAELFPDEAERQAQRATYEQRLQVELDVISNMGFPGYFLIVADFIEWARNNGVPVGPGRGSGAGSLVAYAMGITDLDPLAYDLLFERFLNPERVSMPDFDIDFCMDGRDRVIDYVAQRYGERRVSQIITYGSMAAKAVIRDVGRVLGHGYGYVDRIAKQVPFAVDMTLDKALGFAKGKDGADDEKLKNQFSQELRQSYDTDEEVRYLIDMARSLEGLTRNPGKHAGGVVISPADLTEFTPLYCEPGGGNRVTQFDKDDVEAVGLVKFDFLGLRTLTIIDRAVHIVNEVRQKKGENPLDIRQLPLDDKAAYNLLRKGETTAVFQLESSGMRRLIKRLLPDQFEDIVALVALYRPGPLESGMVDDYCDRKHGQKVVYPHPRLEKVLEPTYGVILYQEQVMQIAQELAGYSLGGADLLRRAMGKKKVEEMAKQRQVFVDGAAERGVEADNAGYIFDLIEKFAGYGFNKSHSAAYALVSYQTAWLKAHHPAAFMCAVLSADMDHTDKVVTMIDECHRMDIEVHAPNVNHSGYDFTTIDEHGIRYGLGALKGVGRGAIEAIIAERDRGGAFTDLFEFCRRIDTSKTNRRMLEAMIRAGALDDLGPNRASLVHGLGRALTAAEQQRNAASAGQNDLFGMAEPDATPVFSLQAIEDWSDDDRLRAERETLGLYLSGHPITAWEDELAQFTDGKIAEIVGDLTPPDAASGNGGGRNGRKRVVLAGLVTDLQRRKRRMFFKLDDRSGRIDCSLFEEKAAAFTHLLQPDRLLVVSGTLSYDDFADGWKISPREIMELGEARERYAERILLKLAGGNGLDMARLAGYLDQYRNGEDEGGCAISIRYENALASASFRLPGRRVRACDELLGGLREILGHDAVAVRYRRTAGEQPAAG